MNNKTTITLSTIFFLFFYVNFNLIAQVQITPPKKGNAQTVNSVKPSKIFTSAVKGQYSKTSQTEKKWDISYNSTGIKHGDTRQISITDSIKAVKTLYKKSDKSNVTQEKELTTNPVIVDPNVALDFQGNAYNGYHPPDNNIAVGDNGKIVSVTNSSIFFANENGTLLEEQSLGSFFSPLNLSGFYFDPRVLYDPSTNKFIVVALNGNTPSNSKIVVAFSSTNNPEDNWWLYTIDGDPANENAWFDFPSIGITTDELYISGNLYDSNDNFVHSLFFQIDKTNGFTGGSLNWLYWDGITDAHGDTDFSLTPISYGFDNTIQPGIYLLSSDYGGGDEVMLYWTTATIDNNPTLQVNTVSVPAYELSGNGLQLGSNDVMRTNDCRMQSGFFANSLIHFTMNTDVFDGYTGIYYGRLDVSDIDNISSSNRTFGLEGYEYAFPSIAPFTTSTTDKTVLISFLRTGASIYPQFRVVTCDDSYDWSGSVSVRGGDSFVDDASGSIERWGDYTGISRRHLTSSVEVWVAGCFGENSINGSNNVLNTWIGKITVGASPDAPVTDFIANQTNIFEGDQIIFTDLSTNTPTSWAWSFPGGNPSNSTTQNPTVTYNTAGTYNVTLIASNAGGSDTEVKNFYITVNSEIEAPIANFSANQTIIYEGDQVSFSDLSTNAPNSWTWSFPGGSPNSSFTQNPVINYNTAGTYNVTLTAYNSEGNDTEVKNFYITVISELDAPVANFTADQTIIYEGDQVSFTDLSTNGPTNWSWSFPGGNPSSSTTQNPIVAYNTTGTYNVTLTASNSTGSDTEVKNLYITVISESDAPIANFTADQTIIYEGDQVSFTDLSTNGPTDWSWSFPGGNPSSSTTQNPIVAYNTTGTYNVTLTASNSTGSDTEVKSLYITVISELDAPVANFTADQIIIQEGEQVNFTDLSTNGPTNWSWSFPGGNPTTSTTQHPTVTYNTAGVYDVTLIATNSTGSDAEVKNLYITVLEEVETPLANFTANQTLITEGQQVVFTDLSTNSPTNWVWSFPGGSPSTSTNQHPIILYSTAGTYDVILIASNSDGNDVETKVSYIVVTTTTETPIADFIADQTTITASEQVNFTDLSTNSPTSWVWSFSGGTPSVSTDQNPTITYATAGNYDVTLVASNNEGNNAVTKTLYITVNPVIEPPAADFIADQTIISTGDQVSFTDLSTNSPTNWVWALPGGTPSVSTNQHPVVTYATAGVYDVTLVASNSAGNDPKTKTFYITVNDITEAPTADFIANQTIISEGDLVSFTDLSINNPTSWVWAFSGGSPSIAIDNAPVITYPTAGTYDVTLVASNSEGNDTKTKTMYITVNSSTAAPVANFIANQTSILEGEQVGFTDLSTNTPTNWVWAFTGGNPTVSTNQHPTVTYTTAGTYDVTLVASNSEGNNTETKTFYITVSEPPQAPTAVFEADNTDIIAGGIVQFTDLSTNNPANWVWSFPGGTPSSSNLQNPIIVYSSTGNYDVSLVVSNGVGNNVLTKTAYIHVGLIDATEELTSTITDFKIFPNPSSSEGRITVEFELKETTELDFYILDNQGRVVKHLLHNRIKMGRNRLAFNANMLPAGNYHLLIQNQAKENLQNGKIIIID